MNNLQSVLSVGKFEMIGDELVVTNPSNPVPRTDMQTIPAWAPELHRAPQPLSREQEVNALLRQVAALRHRNEELENSLYEETTEARRAGFLAGLATRVQAIEEAQKDITAQIKLNEGLVLEASRLQKQLTTAENRARFSRDLARSTEMAQQNLTLFHERDRIEHAKAAGIHVEKGKKEKVKKVEVGPNGICFSKERGDSSKLGRNWGKKFAMLEQFVRENGHARVPPTEGKIYYWLCNQRRRFRINVNPNMHNPSSYSPLTEEELKKLVDLGVNLNTPARPKVAEKRRVKRMEREACAALSELAGIAELPQQK